MESRRLSTLLGPTELDRIEILKLDIEGAEIEVIEDVLTDGIRPRQILVEFDQLQKQTRPHRARVRATLRLLSDAGYRLLRREQFNYSFGR